MQSCVVELSLGSSCCSTISLRKRGKEEREGSETEKEKRASRGRREEITEGESRENGVRQKEGGEWRERKEKGDREWRMRGGKER